MNGIGRPGGKGVTGIPKTRAQPTPPRSYRQSWRSLFVIIVVTAVVLFLTPYWVMSNYSPEHEEYQEYDPYDPDLPPPSDDDYDDYIDEDYFEPPPPPDQDEVQAEIDAQEQAEYEEYENWWDDMMDAAEQSQYDNMDSDDPGGDF